MVGIVVLGATLFTACRKDNVLTSTSGKSAMTEAEGKMLETRIQNFYAKMKALKSASGGAAKGTSQNLITLSDAEFLTGATYNYYATRSSDDLVQGFDIKFTEPIIDDKIDEVHLTEAFYRIKDSILSVGSPVVYVDKQLESFNLEVYVEKVMLFSI